MNKPDKFHMTPLMYAIGCGSVHTVKKLVEPGADVNGACNRYGYTPLMLTARDGQCECMKVLITAGADVNKVDVNNRTALYEAVENGHDDCVEVLLEADIDCYDSEYLTSLEDEKQLYPGLHPTHVAIQKDNLGCVKRLIEYTGGNEIRHGNEIHHGFTPLMLAAKHGSLQCLQFLLEDGSDASVKCSEGLTALMYAVKEGQVRCAKLILEAGADVNDTCEQGTSALMYAARIGHVECLDFLLHNGADVSLQNSQRYSALECAAEGNHVECVERLLDAGADVKPGSLALQLVVRSDTPESERILGRLVESGVDVCESPVPLLPLAAACDALRHIRFLLCVGADVNAVNNIGETALLAACNLYQPTSPETQSEWQAWLQRKHECIELLLEKGADVNATDSQGATALIRLAQKGQCELLAELVIKAGADVNIRRIYDGATALFVAVQRRWAKDELVEMLIKSGADVNIANNYGTTPLMFATVSNDVKCREILLTAGADVNNPQGGADGKAQ